jgi:sulfite exporter TauE/SafE
MDSHLAVLLWTAVSIGVVHTLLGPDHYLPFVALARAGDWSRRKTLWVTSLCGVGHVAGSVVLGFLGVALGWAAGSIAVFQSVRGSWAAWGLMGFGLAYTAWGVRRALRGRTHTHAHVHANGTRHEHAHDHTREHAHPHLEPRTATTTPWVLFIIFVLGPCEALIPLLMVPASEHSWSGLIAVVGVFGLATIATMVVVTVALLYGLRFVSLSPLERWSHALAGLTLIACGGAIQWLGL